MKGLTLSHLHFAFYISNLNFPPKENFPILVRMKILHSGDNFGFSVKILGRGENFWFGGNFEFGRKFIFAFCI